MSIIAIAYLVPAGITVLQALRDELSCLHVPLWCEVFAGLSWRMYCSLEVFSSVCTPTTVMPRYVVKHLVYDRHNGNMYWPDQAQWWSYRIWVSRGQRMSFHGYGPCIPLNPEFLGQVNQLGIQLQYSHNGLSPVEFCTLVERHPGLFDIMFRSRMSDFSEEYIEFSDEFISSLGKGKGKAPLSRIGDGLRL